MVAVPRSPARPQDASTKMRCSGSISDASWRPMPKNWYELVRPSAAMALLSADLFTVSSGSPLEATSMVNVPCLRASPRLRIGHPRHPMLLDLQVEVDGVGDVLIDQHDVVQRNAMAVLFYEQDTEAGVPQVLLEVGAQGPRQLGGSCAREEDATCE